MSETTGDDVSGEKTSPPQPKRRKAANPHASVTVLRKRVVALERDVGNLHARLNEMHLRLFGGRGLP